MDLTSPITGAAVDGLTNPTYTIAADTPQETNQKAYIVTALGGTQSGVAPHTSGKPFQLVISRPKTVKLPTAAVLETTGFQGNVPSNEHKFMTRKSVNVNSIGGYGRVLIETRFVVPVGAVENGPGEISAALSAHFGAITQDVNDWLDIITSGSL